MEVERAIRKAVGVLTPVGVVVWVPADPAQGPLAGSVLAGPDQRGVISAMSAGISRGHHQPRASAGCAASGSRTNQCSGGQMIHCPSQAPLDLSQSAIRFNTVETRAITDRMLKTDESDH